MDSIRHAQCKYSSQQSDLSPMLAILSSRFAKKIRRTSFLKGRMGSAPCNGAPMVAGGLRALCKRPSGAFVAQRRQVPMPASSNRKLLGLVESWRHPQKRIWNTAW